MDEVIDNMYNKYLKGFKYVPKYSIQEWLGYIGKLDKPKHLYKYEERDEIEVRVINRSFSYHNFNECKNIIRKGQDIKGWFYVGDTFTCTKQMYEYLSGDNPDKLIVVEMIE